MPTDDTPRELTPPQRDELLSTLEDRFAANMRRHPDLEWADVRARLDACLLYTSRCV